MKFLKNLGKRFGVACAVAAGAVAGFFGNIVHAQTVDLSAPLASSSALYVASQSDIETYILVIFGVVATLSLLVILLVWGLKWVKSIFVKRKRR